VVEAYAVLDLRLQNAAAADQTLPRKGT
jgi:hypothetical protein